ncbi:Rz1-like lysis system protein LysC [Klebsiella pneumoniae]|uniref:Rz1-like lysis system protein LysC n=1 Tax=Klebsiella pneumoniae TaxID=573 RepID=UPI000E2C30D0|nr:peptidase [Klebsiella pneumoniae]SXW07164.1 Uncharacterised protein [Klebsiella pneumoniae]VFZ37141.1 Uncharacterised protein [Klebsiella pneumoniae]
MEHVQYPPFLPLPQRADQNMTQDTAWQTTRTIYVPAPVVPISADLIADTPIPGMEVPFTWQASLELNAKLYSALGQCNLDKAGIRSIEERRNILLSEGKSER